MILINLTNGVLGLDGIIQLEPQVPKLLPETQDYVERAQRLQKAGLVSVKFDELPPVQKEEPKPVLVAPPEPEVVVVEKPKKKNSLGGTK